MYELDAALTRLANGSAGQHLLVDPLMIAAAHGGVIDTPEMIPLLKSGMLMGQLGIEAKITKLPSRGSNPVETK